MEENYFLSEPLPGDIPSLVKYLNDDEMYNNTLRIPRPYLESDGEWFLNFCRERNKMAGRTMEWAIRRQDGELIGGIGLQGGNNENPHRDLLGYWLARPYWNRKIMSRTVAVFCSYVMNRDPLVRLEAHVFKHNMASCRILEKAGFIREGILKKYFFKDGIYIDSYLYALVKEPTAYEIKNPGLTG